MGGGVRFKEYNIGDIFEECKRGKRLIRENYTEGNIPYVSSSAMNNGIDAFIGNKNNVRKFENCLSIANSGSVGTCFYQPFLFIASDHITHLKNKKLNSYQYLYIATLLNRLSEKYNFNREINDKRINREKTMLPVDNNYEIDYRYMENYIKTKLIEKYEEYLEYIE